MHIITPPTLRFSGYDKRSPEEKKARRAELRQEIIDARKKGVDYLTVPPGIYVTPPFIKYVGPFYRYIGQIEFDKLFAGETITAPRHNNRRVDITNDPYYLLGMYGTAKYRISFKETDKFDPNMVDLGIDSSEPHTDNKNEEMGEFWLEGGYNLADVAHIELIENGRLGDMKKLDIEKLKAKVTPENAIIPSIKSSDQLDQDAFIPSSSQPKLETEPMPAKSDKFIPGSTNSTQSEAAKETSQTVPKLTSTRTSWKEMILDARKQGQIYLSDNEFVVNIKYKGPFYRLIGNEELEKVLAGEHVTSSLKWHHGVVTDVTNDPNYGNATGRYRIKFKKSEKFDPILTSIQHNGPKTVNKNEELGEYHLIGGYSIDDIEVIDDYEGNGKWHQIYPTPSAETSEPERTDKITVSKPATPHANDSKESLKDECNKPAIQDAPVPIQPDMTPMEVQDSTASLKQEAITERPKDKSKFPTVTQQNWASLSFLGKNKQNWQNTAYKKTFVACNVIAVLGSIAALALGPTGIFMIPPVAIFLALGLSPTLKALFNQEIERKL